MLELLKAVASEHAALQEENAKLRLLLREGRTLVLPIAYGGPPSDLAAIGLWTVKAANAVDG